MKSRCLSVGTLACAVVASLVMTACATRSERQTLVVVVPEADGRVGTVLMRTPQGEATIHTPYAAARSQAAGAPEVSMLSEVEVKTTFAAALAARPERPQSFTLQFLEGSDELTPDSRQHLPTILAELRRRAGAEISVVGHTDRVGKLDYNDRLSLQRAQRVADELVRIGIASQTISVAGRGERELLVVTEDEVAELHNRRVEVSVR